MVKINFLRNNSKKLRLLLFIFQFLSLIELSINGDCKNIESLLNTKCYNDLITFNHDTWRAGHPITNNKGELFIEFSTNPKESKKRLFYALNTKGRYYFPGEPVFKLIDDIKCQNCNNNKYKGRFESRNLFVSLNDNPSKSKQYFFSMSSYNSTVELHDIENNKYFAWDTIKFFGFDAAIFSYEYSLFEIQNSNTYIIAVVESAGYVNSNEFANKYTLRKFQFGSFSSNAYVQLKGIKTSNKYDDRVISAFYLNKGSTKLIVLFFLKLNVGYDCLFYDENLNYKNHTKFSDVSNIWDGWGLFNKAIHIKDDYAAFVYYTNGNSQTSLKFRFMKYKADYKFEDKITRDFSDYSFRQDVQANGFYKLTDERIVLFTEKEGFKTMYMFLFDFYNNYAGIKIREYKFSYTNKRFAREMDVTMYNGYIVFSATLGEISDNPSNTFAILMIFGFANGTDHTIDISPYLMDTGYYNPSNNLYNYLMSTMKIDNNIFDYQKIEKIRLISICDELLLFKGELGISQEDTTLPLNDLFDANHTLLQNRSKRKKENKLYILEYQFMVKEPDFDTFYGAANKVIDDKLNSVNAKNYYQPKTLNGRVNILKFKLCHRFCIECIEYGPSDNDQRCVDCKSPYTYDYLTYVNRFTGNCVPSGYMYDDINRILKPCNTESSYKYYYNKTHHNEKFCFLAQYECPNVYPFLNETTNECYDNGSYSYDVYEEEEQRQSTVMTETPVEKSTEGIIEPINPVNPVIIIEDECNENNTLNGTCQNLTNQDLYKAIYEQVLSRFPPNGNSVILPGKKGYNFQVTTAQNEMQSKNKPSDNTIIDLGDCEEKLKASNGITGDASLLIYKFYKEGETVRENEIQYEVYDPYNHIKLSNLDICDKIKIHVPMNLSQDPNIYQNILDQGYDPFDLNDKFYREICTQYNSENGTDVLLDAREEYYYSPIVDETTCQGNCHFSAYSLDTKYLTCECDPNNDGIVTLDVKHMDEKNIAYSFYSSLKLSNYKVVICYNLVFNFKVFCHNYGSIISAILLGLYIASMIYYSLRTIQPLKVEISKFLFETEEMNNISPNIETKKLSQQRNKSKKTTSKKKSKKNKNNDNDNNKEFPPKRKSINSKIGTTRTKDTSITFKESANLKDSKRNSLVYKNNKNDIMINKYSNDILINKQEKSPIALNNKNKNFDKKEKNEEKKKEEEEILDPDLLDNYEFNNLEYEQACEYDRRSFCRTYISVLMREELVLFTFFSWHDYNLFYIKIARFLVLMCTSFTMTALFFFHKTMYKKQDVEENWSFVQKLPQLLFVLIANHIIEVYLCFLSMTDASIYEIKSLAKTPNNGKKVIDIIDCMKTKLIIFFISTFILFLAFWYFISAFCAVYQNTQYIFIRDSFMSFAASLLDPFIIFGLTMLLRKISLSVFCRKKAKCLYKLSDIIPIF